MAKRNAANPKRETKSVINGIASRFPIGMKTGFYPSMNISGAFQRSVANLDRLTLEQLRTFSRTIVAQRAIDKIANGVLGMQMFVKPPRDLSKDETALDHCNKLEKALARPNRDDQNTYRKFLSAVITDILVLGFAAIERQPGTPKDQPFWLWPANAANIRANPNWSADKEGIEPRYYDFSPNPKGQQGIPLLSKNLFLVLRKTTTWELIPPSPLEVAYNMISAFLGLGEFQQLTTSSATQEYILDIGDTTRPELEAFREYWQEEVLGQGKTPIVAGKGLVKSVKVGAAADEGLYHKYAEFVLKMIALAFGMTGRDFNLTDHDNRATAGVAADSSFQDAILPMALTIREHLEIEVIDFYSPEYELQISDSEPRSEDEEAATAETLFTGNLITRNEARRRTGDDTCGPIGDFFSDGTRLLPEDEQLAKIEADEAHSQSLKEQLIQPKQDAAANNGKETAPPSGNPAIKPKAPPIPVGKDKEVNGKKPPIAPPKAKSPVAPPKKKVAASVRHRRGVGGWSRV